MLSYVQVACRRDERIFHACRQLSDCGQLGKLERRRVARSPVAVPFLRQEKRVLEASSDLLDLRIFEGEQLVRLVSLQTLVCVESALAVGVLASCDHFALAAQEHRVFVAT